MNENADNRFASIDQFRRKGLQGKNVEQRKERVENCH